MGRFDVFGEHFEVEIPDAEAGDQPQILTHDIETKQIR